MFLQTTFVPSCVDTHAICVISHNITWLCVKSLDILKETSGQFRASVCGHKKGSLWRDLETCQVVFEAIKADILRQNHILYYVWFSHPKPNQSVWTILSQHTWLLSGGGWWSYLRRLPSQWPQFKTAFQNKLYFWQDIGTFWTMFAPTKPGAFYAKTWSFPNLTQWSLCLNLTRT